MEQSIQESVARELPSKGVLNWNAKSFWKIDADWNDLFVSVLRSQGFPEEKRDKMIRQIFGPDIKIGHACTHMKSLFQWARRPLCVAWLRVELVDGPDPLIMLAYMLAVPNGFEKKEEGNHTIYLRKYDVLSMYGYAGTRQHSSLADISYWLRYGAPGTFEDWSPPADHNQETQDEEEYLTDTTTQTSPDR